MSNRADAIIDALEEVECAARELAEHLVEDEAHLNLEGEERDDIRALGDAFEKLDRARSDEGVRVSNGPGKKGGADPLRQAESLFYSLPRPGKKGGEK